MTSREPYPGLSLDPTLQGIIFADPRPGTVDELHTLLKPSQSGLGKVVHQLRTLLPGRIRASADAGVRFSARITPVAGEVYVDLEDVSRPEQAAGWAALQLYRLRTDKWRPLHLRAIDPNRAPGLIYWSALRGEAPRPAWVTPSPNLVPSEIVPRSKPPLHTAISVQNSGQQTLPDLLDAVKGVYDQLYPEADTSRAVGSIVGATSVEAFRDAWFEGLGRPDPMDGVQSLLHSGVFTASQPQPVPKVL